MIKKSVHKKSMSVLSFIMIANLIVAVLFGTIMVAGVSSKASYSTETPSVILGSARLTDGVYFYPEASIAGEQIRTLLINFSNSVAANDEIILPTTPAGFTVSDKSLTNKYAKRIDIAAGTPSTAIAQYIRSIGFIIGSEQQSVDVTVTTEEILYDTYYNQETQHYYQYIPYGAEADKSWVLAYQSASAMSFLGRTGYLATIMDLKEDTFVNALSGGQTGWLGGTILGNTGPSENSLFYSGFNSSIGSEAGWYWACGPERGTYFYASNSLRTNSYSVPGSIHAATADTATDNTYPDAYYNWARGNVSYEPNNLTAFVSDTSGDYETCLTTLEVVNNTGKQGTKFSWNDKREDGPGGGEWELKGYFVEYGDQLKGDSSSAGSGTTFASDSSLLHQPSGEIRLTDLEWLNSSTYRCGIELPEISKMVTISVDSGYFSVPSLDGALTFLGGTTGTSYIHSYNSSQKFESAVFSYDNPIAAQGTLSKVIYSQDFQTEQIITATSSTVAPIDGDMYFQGHFYRYVSGSISWPDAVMRAGETVDPYFGGRGYIATATSQAENSILLRLVDNGGTYGDHWYDAWLGGLWQRNSGTLFDPVIDRGIDGNELSYSDLSSVGISNISSLLKDYTLDFSFGYTGTNSGTAICNNPDIVRYYWIDGPEAGHELPNNTSDFAPWHQTSTGVQDEPNSGDFVYIGWNGANWDDLSAFDDSSYGNYRTISGYLVEFSGFEGGTTDGVIKETDKSVPYAPTATQASSISSNGFTANWTGVSEASGYRLDVANDSSFSQMVSGFNNLDVGNQTSYSLSGLNSASTYYYRVRAYTVDDDMSANSNTITVTTDQNITFPTIPTLTYGDVDFNPGAAASSGLTVSYSSSDPDVATIVNNQIHIVGAGSTTITASQNGNDIWQAAVDQTQILTVLPRAITVTADNKSKIYGEEDQALTWRVTSGSLIGSDAPTGTLTREPGENVGEYAILPNDLTAGKNYLLSFVSADLTIAPYLKSNVNGEIRNGSDQDNNGDLSYIAEAAPGNGFAYWSDGKTVFSTNPELTNPTVGIENLRAVFWPITEKTDKKAILMSEKNSAIIQFLNGEVSISLPAHPDTESVIAVTPLHDQNFNGSLPSGMVPVPLYYSFQRSENLIDIPIRVEISLDKMNLGISENESRSLAIYHWDEQNQIWQKSSISSQGYDSDNNILWAELDHFSSFGIFYSNEELTRTGEQAQNGPLPLLIVLAGTLSGIIIIRKRFLNMHKEN
jgi:hypothetical protein